MPRPIVTLTTDFGLDDHFVGVMKGVILGIAPQARIVDISHAVTPFDIRDGAFTIAQAYRWFPPRTVHVVVVDPGVGTARRPLYAEAAGQRFAAPDNGVLGMILDREKHKVRAITTPRFLPNDASATFHGRDIFAPVAAHIAAGLAPAKLGKLIHDYHRGLPYAATRIGRRLWSGMVLKVDRFGNLITNLDTAGFADLALRPFELAVGACTVTRLVRTFGDAPAGEPVLVAGSCGYYEVVVNQASAARTLGMVAGSPVELTVY